MEKHVCTICEWEYDPQAGDPDNGIPAGTKFSDLPATWTCPVCGASAEDFDVA